LLALDKPAWLAVQNACKLIGLALFIPLGFHFNGFRGALYGLVGSEVLRYASSAWALALQGCGALILDLSITALLGVTTTIMILVDHKLMATFNNAPASAAISGVLVCLIWSPLAHRVYRSMRAPASTIQPAPA
jgi:hypothetical protein